MSDVQIDSEPVLPLLTYDELEAGREFRALEIDVTPELVADYLSVVGDASAAYTDEAAARQAGLPGCPAPAGLWGIWGRAAYLQDHRMPGGGVLAGEDIVHTRPVLVGDRLVFRARVVEQFMKNERGRIRFEITGHNDAGALCGAVRISAIWPKAA
jgi:acyl dehydratase